MQLDGVQVQDEGYEEDAHLVQEKGLHNSGLVPDLLLLSSEISKTLDGFSCTGRM